MTWSIVARDPATGAFGVAVATKFFAVGALTPHAEGGVGALATQALMNPTFGPRGLRLLREGVPAPVIVELFRDGRPRPSAPATAYPGCTGADRRAYRIGLRRLVRARCRRRLLCRGQHADRRARDRRHGDGLCARKRAALRPPPDPGAGSGRSRRRRQTRQAIRGAPHSHDRGVPRALATGRRSRRSPGRTRPPGSRIARTLRAISSPACRRAPIRPASPTAPRSRRGLRLQRREWGEQDACDA